MPKAIKKKIKHKEGGADHEIQDRLAGIQQELKKKQKSVMAYGGIALAAAVAIGGMAYYRAAANQNAMQHEYEAYKAYHNLYQKTPAARQDQLRLALDLFQKSYAEKKNPSVLLYVASVQAELGQSDEALKTLEAFIKTHGRVTDLMPIVYQQIAAIQLGRNNSVEALKALDAIAQLPGPMLKDQALLESGKILEKDGKKEEALAKYREIKEKYPDSPYLQEAKARLGEKPEEQKQGEPKTKEK